ncbi:MAG: hypothetical protein IJH78_02165 [Clostridia bacterium]|nr:hypothetical protein [Clostridia bacterium]
MEQSSIIRYDPEFISRFERLKELIEEEDRSVLHRYLIDGFGYIFSTFQRCARQDAAGALREFEEADEQTKRELMRPLSYRQYRMIERAFSIWENEKELVIWSIWDFLHDNGRIYEKKVMSSAEVSGCSLILEEVYRCLGDEGSADRDKRGCKSI